MANSEIIDLDPVELRQRDLVLAQRAFHRLSPAEQLRYTLRLPPAERWLACELALDLPALVHAMPPQDLWLTIRAVGQSEGVALLAAATPEQTQFCLDVECWQRDDWMPTVTAAWLAMMVAAGEAKMVEFFTALDQDWVGLLLKRWLVVYRRVGDEDPADAIPWPREESPFTLDGAYFFQIADERLDPVLRPLLECGARHDLAMFYSLLDALCGLLSSEQEELAYQARTRRLEECGFPEWQEAIGVYRRLTREQFERLPKRVMAAAEREHATVSGQVALAATGAARPRLLHEALATLEDAALHDACLVELARLANRMLVADRHAITPETLAAAVAKAGAYVNLGLECASEGALPQAARLLVERPLVQCLQLGFSLVLELRDRVRAALRDRPLPEINDDPTTAAALVTERLRAAAWEWPKFYLGPQTPDGALHREFQTRDELGLVETALLSY
ncbi:MAG: hypothetical protein HY696_02225 [Deltaproteobacteria bacterium]|nr:hypothetical protein [Deltaproteobacteria bacterium]